MSPDYIGPATPHQRVYIRPGVFTRAHRPWDELSLPCGARVGSRSSNPFYTEPWQSTWTPRGPYVQVPNVQEVKLDKRGESGGIAGATVQIENIAYARVGPGVDPEVNPAAYHVRERGYLAPLRGLLLPASEQPAQPPLLDEQGTPVAANEWAGRLSFQAQITIYQGYGENLVKVFTGLIEDTDSTSHPDRITITVRDFGQVFTDEVFFGWNKDPVIDTPVVFVDREEASQIRFVGYNAHASSEAPDHPPKLGVDSDDETRWQSETVGASETTEFFEIALREGEYKDFDLYPFRTMQMFVSIRPAALKGGGAPMRGGVPLPVGTWVDVHTEDHEVGELVPGAYGGIPFTHKVASTITGYDRYFLDPEQTTYTLGENSVLRVSFRKLVKVLGGFAAAVYEMVGRRTAISAAEAKAEVVTVEDIADVVRIICQWAGFKEWDIPDTGTKLPVRITANKGTSYLEVIDKVCKGIGYNFFMADPAPDGPHGEGVGSLGIPTFRKPQVVANTTPVATVTDRTLLTAINLKQNEEVLKYVIRIYGLTKTVPGDLAAGLPASHRLVYTFRPPWTGDPNYKNPETGKLEPYGDSRLAGVIKHFSHEDNFFATATDCRNAALYVALQMALDSVQATIDIPANPAFDLEDHAQLMDLGTGISTRLAVVSRSSTFTDGEKRKWTMQLTGALIDTPDVRDMVNIITDPEHFPANGLNSLWTDPHLGDGSSLGYG